MNIDDTTNTMLFALSSCASSERHFIAIMKMFARIMRIALEEDLDIDELIMCCKEQSILYQILESEPYGSQKTS